MTSFKSFSHLKLNVTKRGFHRKPIEGPFWFEYKNIDSYCEELTKTAKVNILSSVKDGC